MINIRPYHADDKTDLENIYLIGRRETFTWHNPDLFQISDFTKDTEGETILVCERDSKTVGFISAWLPENFIHHLFILPEYQGQQLGIKLIEEIFNYISKPARLKCIIQNQRACKFYEKHGWEIESTTMEDTLGAYHTYILK